MPESLDRIGALLDAVITSGRIPGVVAMVGRGPAMLGRWVAGQADAAQGRPMRADTVFDLASLTKVVATTTVTLALASRGQLGLGDPVASYLPDSGACRDGGVTIAHLLTHTAGLPDGRKFHRWCGCARNCSATSTRLRLTRRLDPGSSTPTWGSSSSARWWRRQQASRSTSPSAVW